MNYMKQVAEMLGVELGEKFRIRIVRGSDYTPEFDYRITDSRLEFFDGDVLGWIPSADGVLERVLYDQYEIMKLPWKPVKGQEYYMPNIENGHADYCVYVWSNNHKCEDRYNSGLICRTKNEAIEKAEDILEYTGRLIETRALGAAE